MSQALAATQMALGREQQLTALGGVVAAAAHELGTPLATIKLVSTELVEELADQPRTARGRAPDPRPGRPLPRHPACDGPARQGRHAGAPAPSRAWSRRRPRRTPSAARGSSPGSKARGSRTALRASRRSRGGPEIIQGLRNLVQNAVDFARDHSLDRPRLEPGRAARGDRRRRPRLSRRPHRRIGDPFVRRPRTAQEERPGYEGMGLGLFIAKTLLERSGAGSTSATAADDPGDPASFPADRRDRRRRLAAGAGLAIRRAARSRRAGAAPRRRSIA